MNTDHENDIEIIIEAESELSDKRFLLKSILRFAKSSSQRFSDQFLKDLNTKHYSPRVRDKIIETGMYSPSFSIQEGDVANTFLAGEGYDTEIDTDSFLLVFNLPKILDQWWWKGRFREAGVDVKGMVNEWGIIYRKSLPKVWSERSKYQDRTFGFQMERINPEKKHEKGKYYYLWKISPIPPIPADEPID